MTQPNPVNLQPTTYCTQMHMGRRCNGDHSLGYCQIRDEDDRLVASYFERGHGIDLDRVKGALANKGPDEVYCTTEAGEFMLDWCDDMQAVEKPILGASRGGLSSYVSTGGSFVHLNPETARQAATWPTGTIIDGILRTEPDDSWMSALTEGFAGVAPVIGVDFVDTFELSDAGTLGDNWVISYSTGGTMPYVDQVESVHWVDGDNQIMSWQGALAAGFAPVGAIQE